MKKTKSFQKRQSLSEDYLQLVGKVFKNQTDSDLTSYEKVN